MVTTLFSCKGILPLFAFLTGACGTLSFSPYNFWPSAILSLTGLLIVTICCNRNSIWMGFIWGIGLFGTGVSWIYISISQFSGLSNLQSSVIVILLVIYLALYPMIFSSLLTRLYFNTNLWTITINIPALWTMMEFLRSKVLTGFPWLQFGYSQIDGPLKGLAPIFGVEFITAILVSISSLLAVSLIERRPLLGLIAIILLILPFPLCFVKWYRIQPHNSINVMLVQGNISQTIKWDNKQIKSIINTYLKYTLPVLGKVQIVIWPELAIPDSETNQKKFLIRLDQILNIYNTSLITGIIDTHKTKYGYEHYNSIVVLGESIPYRYPSKNHYNKHHLVPFGETIPLENFFKSIIPYFNIPMSSLKKGNYLQPQLKAAGMKFTATICYEIILGDQVRNNFQPDSDFLLAISNDAWFGNSIGPWQHFQMARMRSLELGRPLLCSTNNGITASIFADGTIQKQLPQFTYQVLNVQISPATGLTPYARFSSYPFWIVVIAVNLFSFNFKKLF